MRTLIYQSFRLIVMKTKKDTVAVQNGILYEYNNGITEGGVNKIKLIKRTMYGRNSFEMLKAKVLVHEQFHCEFN